MIKDSPKSNKKPWTIDEDNTLLVLISQQGREGSWPTIASKLGSRTGKQCRERFLNHLSPDIKHTPWTEEEDVIIKRIHAMVGNKWCKYINHLPGRSDNAIKNRWHVLLRAMIEKDHRFSRSYSSSISLSNKSHIESSDDFSFLHLEDSTRSDFSLSSKNKQFSSEYYSDCSYKESLELKKISSSTQLVANSVGMYVFNTSEVLSTNVDKELEELLVLLESQDDTLVGSVSHNDKIIQDISCKAIIENEFNTNNIHDDIECIFPDWFEICLNVSELDSSSTSCNNSIHFNESIVNVDQVVNQQVMQPIEPIECTEGIDQSFVSPSPPPRTAAFRKIFKTISGNSASISSLFGSSLTMSMKDKLVINCENDIMQQEILSPTTSPNSLITMKTATLQISRNNSLSNLFDRYPLTRNNSGNKMNNNHSISTVSSNICHSTPPLIHTPMEHNHQSPSCPVNKRRNPFHFKW